MPIIKHFAGNAISLQAQGVFLDHGAANMVAEYQSQPFRKVCCNEEKTVPASIMIILEAQNGRNHPLMPQGLHFEVWIEERVEHAIRVAILIGEKIAEVGALEWLDVAHGVTA